MFDKHILRGRCATLHPVNLPGIVDAHIWEPEPATVYFWTH